MFEMSLFVEDKALSFLKNLCLARSPGTPLIRRSSQPSISQRDAHDYEHAAVYPTAPPSHVTLPTSSALAAYSTIWP